MKILIVLMVMSVAAATCATGGDVDGTDHRLRCSQLIVRNTAPGRGTGPILVTFGGNGFDLPLLRYRAFALGVPVA